METVEMPEVARAELQKNLARNPKTAGAILSDLETGAFNGQSNCACVYGFAFEAETGRNLLFADSDDAVDIWFDLPREALTPLEEFVFPIRQGWTVATCLEAATLANEIRAWQAAQPSA